MDWSSSSYMPFVAFHNAVPTASDNSYRLAHVSQRKPLNRDKPGFPASPFGLKSIIHSGRLGADRNKGHEIVMKQCDGDDDDRGAGGEKLSLSLANSLRNKSGRPSPLFQSKNMFSLFFFFFPLLLAHDVSLQRVVLPPSSPLIFLFLVSPTTLPSFYRFPIPICQVFFFFLILYQTLFSPASLETCCPLVRH